MTASGGNLSYQWKKNGTAIAGATSSSYSAPAAIWSDAGAQYTVVVSNSAGTLTSTAAAERLALSGDQQVYESLALAPGAGIYELDWSLNYLGTQTPTASLYLEYEVATLSASPLTTLPQSVQEQAEVKIAQSLSTSPPSPTRVLKNGVVLVVPDQQNWFKVSYVAGGVQVDNLAADGSTVAFSQIRSGFSVHTLSGLLHSAPTQITNPYNSIFYNANVLSTSTTWASGSAYVIYTATNVGDLYKAGDCHATTTDANVSPCQTGTDLATAMAAGEQSISDATTYLTTDGTMTTIGGVPVWVATNPRPGGPNGTAAFTTEYRIYFQLNGNVYTGSLVKDGAVVASHHYRTNPLDATTTVYLNYEMRLSQPAVQSLIAGSLL